MRPAVLLALVLLAGCATPSPAARDAENGPPATIDGVTLAARLVDPYAALAPLPPGTRVVQVSSHDRAGGNLDGATGEEPWRTVMDQPDPILRVEGQALILADIRQPGCLARTYTKIPGTLEFLFDGETSPRVRIDAWSYFNGTDAFPVPLVGNAWTSSGGNYSYVPYCFARSFVARIVDHPARWGSTWEGYQFTFDLFPPGTSVATFDPRAEDLRAVAGALARPGPPDRAPDLAATGHLDASGDGSLRCVRVSEITSDDLLKARLRVRGPRVAIDVLLGDLFGDGLEARDVRSVTFGMGPDGGSGSFCLPIPLDGDVTIDVDGAPQARLEAWRGPRVAGSLVGETHEAPTQLGSDITVLDADGSGVLVAAVLDLVGGPVSRYPVEGLQGPIDKGQWFLEGDERVHVDGSPSPTIYGTGHEEWANGAFYFYRGPYTGPLSGAGPFGRTQDGRGTQSEYRVLLSDAIRWSNGIHYGLEHGGGNENVGELARATTFSYRSPATLARADVTLDAPGRTRTLAAYFEGDRDGNVPVSDALRGGSYYRAPPPEESPEGVTLTGVDLDDAANARVRTPSENGGVMLRRTIDQGVAPFSIEVFVDGHDVGAWWWPESNQHKRWHADEFEIPAALTRGKDQIDITLEPSDAGANLFGLEAWARVS